MSSKPITQTDYRYGIGDKYGRAKCDNCNKFRRINAYWQDTNQVLCTECTRIPRLVLASSVRKLSVGIQL